MVVVRVGETEEDLEMDQWVGAAEKQAMEGQLVIVARRRLSAR